MGVRNAVTLNGLMVGLEVDETLESLKLKEKEAAGLSDGLSFGKRSFDSGKRSERSWRKPVDVDVHPQSEQKSLMERSKSVGSVVESAELPQKNGNIENGKWTTAFWINKDEFSAEARVEMSR
ncbi:hypothetical protein AgCh_026446 [Apium graveolens]